MNTQTQEALKNFDWDKVNRKTEDDILTMVSDFQSGRIHNVELAERIAKRCEATFLIACKEALEQPAQELVEIMDVMQYGQSFTKIAAEPAQEPVAYILRNEYNEYRLEPMDNLKITDFPVEVEVKLYTHPHQWQGLTDDEIDAIIKEKDGVFGAVVRAIEAKLKEKNHGSS